MRDALINRAYPDAKHNWDFPHHEIIFLVNLSVLNASMGFFISFNPEKKYPRHLTATGNLFLFKFEYSCGDFKSPPE